MGFVCSLDIAVNSSSLGKLQVLFPGGGRTLSMYILDLCKVYGQVNVSVQGGSLVYGSLTI